MEYTLYLKSEEDYNMIKKILKAFDGSWIRPNIRDKECGLDKAMKDVENGNIIGPFHTVDELMADLMS